jgi:two-component system, response regulator YesN
MYRLLVVDDEAFITDGLARLLQGVREHELDVYRAYSALEALEFLNRASVDIVVTDIQMPGMSGLELLKEIYSRWPSCRVIFLTGHNEFEYAYQAVQYRVIRYILKSEGDEAILAAVEECIQDIDREGENEVLLAQADEQMRLCQPVLRREFLQRMLKGKALPEDARASEFRRLGVGLEAGRPVLLLAARLDRYRAEAQEISAPVDIVMREKLKHVACCEMGLAEPDCMLWLIQPLDGESFERAVVTVKGMAENIQRTCLQSLNASLSFVFDKRTSAWEELPERFSSLKYIVEYRLEPHAELAFADCEFFWGGEEVPSESRTGSGGAHWQIEKLPELAHSLERGDRKEFNALLSEFMDGLRQAGSDVGYSGIELVLSLNLMFLSYINKHGLQSRVASDPGIQEFLDTQEIFLGSGKPERFARIGNRLLDYWQMDEKDRGDAFVESINRYIYENLNADLSLVTLSDKVYLNPSYLSRRYKEIVGRNISDTIAEARMARAKKLLAGNKHKIGEIALLVGYESPAHFSRIFKRQMGMTPQEYRDSLNCRI